VPHELSAQADEDSPEKRPKAAGKKKLLARIMEGILKRSRLV